MPIHTPGSILAPAERIRAIPADHENYIRSPPAFLLASPFYFARTISVIISVREIRKFIRYSPRVGAGG